MWGHSTLKLFPENDKSNECRRAHQSSELNLKRKSIFGSVFVLALCGLIGCRSNWPKPSLTTAKQNNVDIIHKASNSEPDYITVQHCLIGFRGSVPGKPISRSKEEARALATQLLADVKTGANFEEVIRENTNDSPPGIYKMANYGKMTTENGMFDRDGMVPAFGNTGFPLQVGEYGLAEYNSRESPFGWHIVKRIK